MTKLTRKKIRQIIKEAVTSSLRKKPRYLDPDRTFGGMRDYRHHNLQFPPIPPEVGHPEFDDEMIQKMKELRTAKDKQAQFSADELYSAITGDDKPKGSFGIASNYPKSKEMYDKEHSTPYYDDTPTYIDDANEYYDEIYNIAEYYGQAAEDFMEEPATNANDFYFQKLVDKVYKSANHMEGNSLIHLINNIQKFIRVRSARGEHPEFIRLANLMLSDVFKKYSKYFKGSK